MGRPKLEISVQIEFPAWRRAWPRLGHDVPKFLAAAAKGRKFTSPARGEIAIVFADDRRLRVLNARFRGKDRATNVLSFPDPSVPLGGIALAFETVKREAADQNKDFVHHVKHMILHGFLHLLGHDHKTSREARLMERLETDILADMGIPNPYLIETKTRA